MKILYKEPGKDLHSMVIPNNLGVMQQLVGGYIEHVNMYDHGEPASCGILVNEEGKLLGLEKNFKLYEDWIVGPAIFVGEDGEDFTDLSDTDVEMIRQHFKEVGV